MREKYKFTRQAAHPNRSGMAVPPFLTVENVICDLPPVVEQFSQIMVKSNNHIWSQSGQLFSINQTGKERHDPMRATRGDESPLSYLQAAVCYHELHQYSYNKNPQWGPQRILDDRYIEQVTQMGLWPFITFIRSLDPIFFYDSLHHPVVIFYTYKSFGEESLQKHIHRFDFEGYGMKMNERSIAVNNKLPFLWNRLGFNE